MTLWKPLYLVCVLIAKNGNLGIFDITLGVWNKKIRPANKLEFVESRC